MSWTETTRPHYQRATRCYASDLTDDEWGLLAPFMPEPSIRLCQISGQQAAW